ncbi:GH36-type glycosyl hydrolase domain-containing protein [Sphingomonas bacterium]|uniref:GH36-type glycosyl hydrolase domain-containing protein n=1 Tax=Sphingomonas bacterium TaxID=1895847 RepID=UPI001576CA82|nr:hypothetical protein [Sphingomonas bacterium]
MATSTPAGHTVPLDADPVFLLGNYDLTLFAHASGRLSFVSGERGWVRLNEPGGMAAGHAATLTVTGSGPGRTHDLLGPSGICASARRSVRTFGCGTARYTMKPEPGVTVERILSVAPSTAQQRAQAAVVVTIRLTNAGPGPLDIDYAEMIVSNPALVADSATSPIRFDNIARALPGGLGIICDATATSDDPGLLVPIDVPSPYNLYPPSLVLAAAPKAGSSPVAFEQHAIDGGAVALTARSHVRVAPGATRDIVLIIALKSPEVSLAPLERFLDALAPSSSGDWFRRTWVDVLSPLAGVPDAALRAELLWDGHALLAMATYAGYYRQTFIPQGMTGDYVQGFNASPRDHLQHALAAIYLAPELARSTILYTLCQMKPDGAIKFTVSGNGHTAGSTWSPSDQSLFLFYALGEYLQVTHDWSILDATTPYAPALAGPTGTALEKLERAFVHLRDHVSTGSHGLVRMLTGDWNDQIYAGVPEGQYRDTAESQMNSAMVMAIMPAMIEQLDAYAQTQQGERAIVIGHLTSSMRTYADRISQAMMRDVEGRTFARRAWLAPGKALGENNMYLEPQSFLLQAPDFPIARKRRLFRELQRRLMDGEILGPRQREKAVFTSGMIAGTSENGGFWYSLAGQAIAGVATFDRRAALAMLDRLMFRNFGRHHPGYWVGLWTAPDTLNAERAGDIGGLPRPMNDGVFYKMAVYCAHAHAWPVYCYFRIRNAT